METKNNQSSIATKCVIGFIVTLCAILGIAINILNVPVRVLYGALNGASDELLDIVGELDADEENAPEA